MNKQKSSCFPANFDSVQSRFNENHVSQNLVTDEISKILLLHQSLDYLKKCNIKTSLYKTRQWDEQT